MTQVVQVGPAAPQRQVEQELTPQQVARRIELYMSDEFDRGVQAHGGLSLARFALPQIVGEEAPGRLDLYARATPEQRVSLVRASNAIANTAAAANIEQVKAGQVPKEVEQAAEEAMGTYAEIIASTSPEEYMLATAQMAYDGVSVELFEKARTVEGRMRARAELREDVADLRDAIENWPEGVETQEFVWHECGPNGEMVEKSGPLTKVEAEKVLGQLENELKTLSEIDQMDQLELQNLMHKQSQALNLMSNIMSLLHKTAMSIINNLK